MAEAVGTNNTYLDPPSFLPFPIPNFGNGFVEISALTTLVSSTVTESLILGNESGAGVAWATMSAFGLMGAVKACAGAASPGWLRSALSARSGNTDAAIGMEVASDEMGGGAMKIRKSYGEKGPSGLSVDASGFLRLRSKSATSGLKIRWKEIYAFDKLTSRGLGGFPDNRPKSDTIADKSIYRHPQTHLDRRNSEKPPSEQIDVTPAVYFYSANPFHPTHDPWFQIPALFLSILKLGESLVLWKAGAGFLGVITIIPWAYFFLVACIIEAREMIVATRPEVLDGEIDIVVGQFPNMTQFTEPPQRSRVVIGAPRNPRKSIWWKAAWVFGALICPPVAVFIYLSLAQQSNEIVILWLTFQAIWMVGRMLVHHYAESPREAIAARLLYRRAWETLPDIFRKRVVNVMVALSAYVISVHPRQEWAYRDNASTSQELRRIVIETPTISKYPLSFNKESLNSSSYTITGLRVDIEIHAVIGDPTLISAAWLANTPGLTFENLYDTCILHLKLPSPINGPQYVTIPCVRFLTGISASEAPAFDEETNQPLNSLPQFYPKGLSNNGTRNAWWYFIPAENEQWLLIKQDVLSPALGKHSAELISDKRVTAVLSRGNLVISLAHVNEVKSALENSEKARCTLAEILS